MSFVPPLKRWDALDRASAVAHQGRALHRYLRDCVFPFSRHYGAVARERRLSAKDFRRRGPGQAALRLQGGPAAHAGKPQRARDFILVPDPKVLARRPATIARALTRGRKRVQDELGREWRPTFMTSTTGRSAEPVAFLYTQRDVAVMGEAAARVVDMANCSRTSVCSTSSLRAAPRLLDVLRVRAPEEPVLPRHRRRQEHGHGRQPAHPQAPQPDRAWPGCRRSSTTSSSRPLRRARGSPASTR